MYESENSVYCYKGTNTLVNKLNIKDEEEYTKKINEINDGIKYYEKHLETITSDIYKLTYQIDSLSLEDDYKETLKKLKIVVVIYKKYDIL